MSKDQDKIIQKNNNIDDINKNTKNEPELIMNSFEETDWVEIIDIKEEMRSASYKKPEQPDEKTIEAVSELSEIVASTGEKNIAASSEDETNESVKLSEIEIPIHDEASAKDIISQEAAELKKKKILKYKILRNIFMSCFLVFALLLINEMIIKPYRSKKAIEKINHLYQASETMNAPTVSITPAVTPQITEAIKEEPVRDPNKDEQGRLLQFSNLLAENGDVKGWIKVPDTNVDYVVVQSSNDDPEYYLKRNFFKEEDKAGSIFLDYRSSVEKDTKNLVIHGHNMYSTDNMFHYITDYKELDFYKERPVISFDTIYKTGKWKIFAVFITNGTTKKEELFDYTRSEFTSDSDFLNFVYQLRIRSMYFIEDVDINEDDQLLTLSTCSYEVKDYRTVIVARRIRDGEEETVDVDRVTVNPEPLYPWSWYYRYGGKEPKITPTFEEALAAGEIKWYKTPETSDEDIQSKAQ